MSEERSSENFSRVANWVLNQKPEIPDSALKMAGILLLDTLGVAIAAQCLEVATISNEFASDFLNSGNPQSCAPLLMGAGEVSLVGAAWAMATALDNLDGHDGYNPTKGHIGCAVVPALLAFAHHRQALTGRDALIAMTIAYEVAARAAITLHNTVTDYHTSGAWNALGEFWTIEHNYIKPYPICRWAHTVLDAIWLLQQEHGLTVDEVNKVEINTLHEAAQLYPGMPQTTSQAQYSLPFAVANLLRFGRVGVEHVSGEALADSTTAQMLAEIQVQEATRHSERFPAGCWSDVIITLTFHPKLM